jgi:uncharacterized protein YbbC (DUF1343 family)
MNRFKLLLILLITALSCDVVAQPKVKTGIEVLKESNFDILEGKRIGLVTNPTGVDNNLVSTIDILHKAPNVNLVALFGPEHGVRGDVHAGEHVASAKDRITGLPEYSLYGATRKPTQEMLKGLDAIVYDIQDVGTRCYTYISTLGLVMQACAEAGVEVIVLDRPNPLGGIKMEGPVVKSGFFSFVGMYEIPYIYGLTIGEFALMINKEGMARGQKGLDTPKPCKLTIVSMEGWRRDMLYEDTGLKWINPSPRIPYYSSALGYPVTGMVGDIPTYMSNGCDYSLPFEVFAAEWIKDGYKFAAELNALKLPGVIFRPIHFRPFNGARKDKLCSGVQVYFTDWNTARVTEIQFYVMQIAHKMYPDVNPFATDASKFNMYDKISGNSKIRTIFAQRYMFEDIRQLWRADDAAYRAKASQYFLYK